ncbi:MAG: hypothetical protein U0V02_09645 [Anaerolineales bacterium]
MNIQSFYQDIASFWSDISPIIVAHFLFTFALLWVTNYSTEKITEYFFSFFRSATYLKWKHIFGEFDLMPKIPFIVVVLLLVYFVALSGILGFITSGEGNPLAFSYGNDEFWLETNESSILNNLIDLASYQPDTEIQTYQILQFKDKLLAEYKIKYSEEYHSWFDWLGHNQTKWSKYYEYSIIIFIIFLTILIRSFLKKPRGINYQRIILVFAVTLISTIGTRYMAEQYIEKQISTEVFFSLQMILRDDDLRMGKLNEDEIQIIQCEFANERKNPGHYLVPHYWVSRLLDGYLPRVFTSHSKYPWSPPENCR